MLTDQERAAIVKSWSLVVPIAETAADLFYQRLFELEPKYRSLFPDDMEKQKRKLVAMLSFIVKCMDWLPENWADDVAPEEDLCIVILAMGRRHLSLYNVPDESYDTVGAALLWTLEQGLGDAFTDDLRATWTKLYGVVALTMKMGGRASKVQMDIGQVA